MPNDGSRIRLYIAEEQQLLREAFLSFFSSHSAIEVVGASDETDGEVLAPAVATARPNVVVVGVKTLHPESVGKLKMLWESCPGVAIVLLSSHYDIHGIKALKELSQDAAGGCAFLLKHTIDTVEQLTQVVQSVAQGRVIVDPSVMEGLMATTDIKSTLLKELTSRELEVLSWLAKGYRNDTVAEVLGLEPKTVERHINNIYSKLNDGTAQSRHARVRAVMLYLRATGQLLAEDPSPA
ncbi:MAG: response regulator transcription factor [Chloroflexota bacterium]|nr:response regulator transcription factor [Chloroflexota bacterium]